MKTTIIFDHENGFCSQMSIVAADGSRVDVNHVCVRTNFSETEQFDCVVDFRVEVLGVRDLQDRAVLRDLFDALMTLKC